MMIVGRFIDISDIRFKLEKWYRSHEQQMIIIGLLN